VAVGLSDEEWADPIFGKSAGGTFCADRCMQHYILPLLELGILAFCV
jgi:hypothetical protein